MKMPPCKDCAQRTAECHAACASYTRWKGSIPRPSVEEAIPQVQASAPNNAIVQAYSVRVKKICEE